MRRLTIEWSLKDIDKMMQKLLESYKAQGGSAEITAEIQQRGSQMLELLKKVKSLEMLHILKYSEEEIAAILRVEIKDPSLNFEELMNNALKSSGRIKIQLLEHEQEGTYVYFVEGKPVQLEDGVDPHKRVNMYPFVPFVVREGKLRITLLGDNKQVKDFLKYAEELGVHYRLISLMDANFSPNSPVTRLTEKQREAIVLAFKLGYFDTPRKITTEQLAQKLSLADSTLVVHLRRAERRLLSEILNLDTAI